MVVHPEEEVLSAWLDGETPPEETRIIQVHVRECALCRARLDSLAEVTTALAPLRSVVAPATLKARLKSEWETRWGRLVPRRSLGSFALAWSPALAAGVVLALFAPPFHSPETPPLSEQAPPATTSKTQIAANLENNPSVPVTASPTTEPEKAQKRLETEKPSISPRRLFAPAAASLALTLPHPKAPSRRRVGGTSQYEATSNLSSVKLSFSDLQHRTMKDQIPGKMESFDFLNEKIKDKDTSLSASIQKLNSEPEGVVQKPIEEQKVNRSLPSLLAANLSAQSGKGRVFELSVEDDPNGPPPPSPKQTSCVWAVQNRSTGLSRGGAITRHYDAEGELKSVELSLPDGDGPVAPETETSPPPTDASVVSPTLPAETGESTTGNSPASPPTANPTPSDTSDQTPLKNPKTSNLNLKGEPHGPSNSSLDSDDDLIARDADPLRLGFSTL